MRSSLALKPAGSATPSRMGRLISDTILSMATRSSTSPGFCIATLPMRDRSRRSGKLGGAHPPAVHLRAQSMRDGDPAQRTCTHVARIEYPHGVAEVRRPGLMVHDHDKPPVVSRIR